MSDILLERQHGKIPWRYVWHNLGKKLENNVLYLPGQEFPDWLLEMTEDSWKTDVVHDLVRENFQITDRFAAESKQTVSQGLYDALRRYLAGQITDIPHEVHVEQDDGAWRKTLMFAIDDVVWYVHDVSSNGFPLWRPVEYVSKRN